MNINFGQLVHLVFLDNMLRSSFIMGYTVPVCQLKNLQNNHEMLPTTRTMGQQRICKLLFKPVSSSMTRASRDHVVVVFYHCVF